ncbi:response regulator [uncultured Paludibaculum sp.]|uniref:response regulator n=1 Tax=uncultured Paludibaculum sp. TaxID=1765020 RepID=UPI002AAB73CA|nr:response regulator [uncultured Paludibaculum sp.]
MGPNRLRLSTLSTQTSTAAAAIRAAEGSSTPKLQFLASLNHEIRTPLSGILGMADLLLETQLDDEQRDYVTAARQCADGLFDLLNDTLEYTSLASGCVQLDEAEFHLEDTLNNAAAEHMPRARAKGLALRYQADESLPRTAIGDAYRVRQVLTLLTQHAIQTSDSGEIVLQAKSEGVVGRQFTLHLSARCTNNSVTPENVREIFETFDHVEDGAMRRFNGVGLGLALTRRVVQLLGGDMVLESGAGGSLLIAEIPLQLPKPVLVTASVRGSQAKVSACRLLVVEDNRISQQVLSAILNKGGFEFDCASDGPAAIAAAKAQQYQLILMDLQMPGMDGLETTDHIRTIPNYQDVPILALTAEVSDQVRAQCRQKGMAAFLNKPVHAAVLLAEVNAHLG